MKHPTYRDTGEPVLIGDEAFIVDTFGYLSIARLNVDETTLNHASILMSTFYKHRHNAIAAWEALLDESAQPKEKT